MMRATSTLVLTPPQFKTLNFVVLLAFFHLPFMRNPEALNKGSRLDGQGILKGFYFELISQYGSLVTGKCSWKESNALCEGEEPKMLFSSSGATIILWKINMSYA